MKPYELFLSKLFQDFSPGDFPFRLSVESTNRCNLKCVYCPREDSGRGFGHMEFELFASIARQAAGKETIFYPQGFGEPLLHPRMREMLRVANAAGVRCVDLITNGTMLDEANCHAIIDASTTVVTVSLDGIDPDAFERIRVNARYDEVVAGVHRLLRLREERGATFPVVVLSVVGLPEVAPKYEAFRSYWRPFLRDTDDVFMCSAVTWAGAMAMPGREDARPDPDPSRRPPCRMIYKSLQIYYDGRATPCCYDHACALQVGDARTQTVEEIWNGEPLRALRRLHETGRSGEIPLCRDCPDHMP